LHWQRAEFANVDSVTGLRPPFAGDGSLLAAGTLSVRQALPLMLYFFDLVSGTTLVDLTGLQLSDDAAARREARTRAKTHKGSGMIAVTARDESGNLACRVSIE
jgi:hypothetical protein